jgi:CRISPR/Cas system CSM-associated protein Csm4 (group 5 of RAMP superfamily)
LFEYIARNGFGADKSTGNGRFDFEIEEGNPLVESETPDFDCVMLLSNTNSGILKEYQKEEVHYTTQTKFGKVGGLLSANAKFSPFKKPVLLLNPGTVIKTIENVDYMGENFRDVYLLWDNDGTAPQKPKDLDIRHYGIGFPVKMRLK